MTIPFKTTPAQLNNVDQIAADMKRCGVDPDFVKLVSGLAKVDQGVYDLMVMWLEEDDREEITKDLQDSLNDYSKGSVNFRIEHSPDFSGEALIIIESIEVPVSADVIHKVHLDAVEDAVRDAIKMIKRKLEST